MGMSGKKYLTAYLFHKKGAAAPVCYTFATAPLIFQPIPALHPS